MCVCIALVTFSWKIMLRSQVMASFAYTLKAIADSSDSCVATSLDTT